ncbi:YceI family protein [Streptomyces sp. NPDC059639]|uniref:YceI family protein n=1 Tax=Streptomyces sp. NPDC059639 TaxID=3346891 RepID=UPI00367569E7
MRIVMLQNRTIASALPVAEPCEALTGFYVIDPVHSRVGFSVRHAMGSQLHGAFGSFEGLLVLDGLRPSRSEAFLTVEAESLDTGLGERDALLTGSGMFDAAAFPQVTFHSTGVVRDGDHGFRLRGILKIKDVERPLTMDVTFGGARRDTLGLSWVGFEGTATLDLSDWGLSGVGPSAGGPGGCADVSLRLVISAVQVFHRPPPA